MRLIDADAFERAVMFSNDEDVQDVIYRLRDFPTIEPEPHWIPVTERMPFAEYGESANVLATCRNREQESPDEYRWVRILYFNGGNWCYPTGETYEQQVIAWMPLPEAWNGDGNA